MSSTQSSALASPPGISPRWRVLAIAFCVYFVGARVGLLTVMPEGIAIFWPPNALIVALLIQRQGANLLLIGAAVVAAEVAADVPTFSLTEALLFGLINFGEASLVWWLLDRWRFDPRFPTLADTGKFLLAGPITASAASALAGAAVYVGFRAEHTSYLEFARIWWAGDALGLLIVTPLVLGFLPLRGRRQPDLVAWTSLAIALGTFITVAAMAFGKGPFGALPPREAVAEVQRLMFLVVLIGLGFSTLLTQLRARHAELAAANQKLRVLNEQLEKRVDERTAELREANVMLARLASVDTLTGVANRRRFEEALSSEIERSRRFGSSVSVMMIDLDRFKAVNDSFGHAAGDRVLQAFVAVLQKNVRSTDLVARYGGEEFAVLMPQTALNGAASCAENARAALAGTEVEGVVRALSASFGIAQFTGDESGARLLARADAALYQAKRNGRDRVEAAP
ncbi:MAG: diguanylate cyclase [Betaproteobacteria bacterium]